jgi:hypothetical protein
MCLIRCGFYAVWLRWYARRLTLVQIPPPNKETDKVIGPVSAMENFVSLVCGFNLDPLTNSRQVEKFQGHGNSVGALALSARNQNLVFCLPVRTHFSQPCPIPPKPHQHFFPSKAEPPITEVDFANDPSL